MSGIDRVAAEPVESQLATGTIKWWHTRWARWGLIALAALIAVAAVAAVSYLAGYQRGARPAENEVVDDGSTRWTCSMHPTVNLPKPGKCPICFMDLIPLEQQAEGHPRELVMSRHAEALAEIQTTKVARTFVTNRLRMVGKVDYDETRLAYITAWVAGRLDRLFIDYTGVRVRKGDHLVSMYSPDLVVAQRELIQAWKNYEKFRDQRRDDYLLRTLKSTEEKLRLLGLTEKQIDEIKKRGTPTDHLTIYAPSGGVVIHKNANEGMYVETGSRIYTIADLSQVWVFMDAYESDLPWIRYGQQVEFTTEAYPGEIFQGRVAFIDPVLNEKTRTSRVRVNVSNKNGHLKPGMFVRAIIKSTVAEGGQVIDNAFAGKWISPHHPEIVRDGPGKCPICGIDLVPAEELGFVNTSADAQPSLVIPVSAPLITGKRAVVYVRVPKASQPTFRGREVVLGLRAGDYYLVRHGLAEGEEVVTAGNFKIDSALQISAKPSMMNPVDRLAIDDSQETGPSGPGVAGSAGGEIDVPADMRLLLSDAYSAYLSASQALADDDLGAARAALKQLLSAIKQVDYEKWLDDDGRSRWKTVTDAIVFATHDALDAEDRQQTRTGFEPLSRAMTALTQSFGHALDHPIYQFHCSMAFSNQGASWLQAKQEAQNPYYGPKMLACGEVTATFHPQGPYNVPEQFRQQLTTVYDAYLAAQTALAGDDPGKARSAMATLQRSASAIDAAGLDARSKNAWMIATSEIRRPLSGDLEELPIEELRVRFQPISATMLGVVDSFGHELDQPLYKAFCPMAFKDQGAPWLQKGQQIANPYFGAEMLGCGSIKREFPTTEAESGALR